MEVGVEVTADELRRVVYVHRKRHTVDPGRQMEVCPVCVELLAMLRAIDPQWD